MPENETNKNLTPSQNGEGNKHNHNRHGHGHGHHGGHNRNTRPEKPRNEEIDEAMAEAHNATAQSAPRPPRPQKPQNQNNRQNSQRGANAPQKAQGYQPQKTAGAPEPKQQGKSNAQNGSRTAAQSGESRKQGDRQNRRQDRMRGRQRDRRNETEPDTSHIPDFLADTGTNLPKRESFFGATTVEDDAMLDAMPADPTLDAVFAGAVNVQPKAAEPENGVEIVGIHFPQGAKIYYFDPAGITFAEGDSAIVETARGLEMGEVGIANRKVAEKDIVQPLKSVIRRATEEDIRHSQQNAAKEAEALGICKTRIAAHHLDMKLTGAQYTFDNAKLIFYFTAAQRVDFRELVKDLATTFRTRIELRQIGSRDEAKMVGGFGMCGRQLCCAAFLPNYCQSTVRMAKHQGLGLNSGKISGICGRLMCCLKFEESTYERELALMPTVNSAVETPDGRGIVTDVRPVGYTVKVKLDEKPEAAPKAFPLSDIRVLVRAESRSEGDTETEESDENEAGETAE